MKPMSMFFLLVTCTAFLRCILASSEQTQDFRIIPGQSETIEISLDVPATPASSCKFHYESSGATPESWVLTITGNPQTGELTCDVSRHHGAETYLLFSKFSLQLGVDELKQVSVFDNDGRLLEDDQYMVEESTVQNTPGWSGQIRGIEVKTSVSQ